MASAVKGGGAGLRRASVTVRRPIDRPSTVGRWLALAVTIVLVLPVVLAGAPPVDAAPALAPVPAVAGTLTMRSTALTSPYELVPDGSGGAWFSTVGAAFGHLSAAHVVTFAQTPPGFRAAGRGVHVGADGNLWLLASSNAYVQSLVKVTPDGTVTRADLYGETPLHLAVGPEGIWYDVATTGRLHRLDWDGENWTIFTPHWVKNMIVHGHDLWFTEKNQSWPTYVVYSMSATFELSEHTAPWIQAPDVLFDGPDGDVWFTDAEGWAGAIGRDLHGPTDLASGQLRRAAALGPDGAVWITDDPGVPALVRIGVDGTSTRVPMPCPVSSVARVGDQLWIACGSSAGIGMLDVLGVPSAPREHEPPVLGAGTVTVTWRSSLLDGGDAIAGYTVRVEPGGATCQQPGGIAGGVLACDLVADLVTGTTYEISVVATNSRGDSPPLRIEITPTAPPSAPGGVVAAPAHRSAAVAWDPPVADGGLPVTAYTVSASPGSATCTSVPPVRTCVVNGLDNGTPYSFTVVAANDKGAGPASAPSSPVVPRRFADVPGGAPFFADVEWLADAGIASGYADGLFHPVVPVSRGAMAAFLYRFLDSPAGVTPPCAGSVFSDVAAGTPFCGEIEWLAAHGIVTGDAGGTFRPGAPVSRQATAAFLHRTAGLASTAVDACPPPPFTDVASDSVFCHDIAWAKANGIVTGDAGGTYRPTAPVSRQAMAAFLHRLDPIVNPS